MNERQLERLNDVSASTQAPSERLHKAISRPDLLENPLIELMRGAHVSLEASTSEKNEPVAVITVNDKYTHRFDIGSRYSKALETTPLADLERRLNDGQYFFVNGELVDCRDGKYNGFVHTDDSITALADVIGISDTSPTRGTTQISKTIALSTVWSDNEITVPMYSEGGDFNSRLMFRWNPFQKNITSNFQLIRLVCLNGMVGLSNFLNSKIPLENRWEEHLEIANKQIQNKINSMMSVRLGEMGCERATVADLLLLEDHARNRIDATNNAHKREDLGNIAAALSPEIHLSGTYKDSVFANKALAAQFPGHLTLFDVYNIATELASHTNPTAKSSDFALDRAANDFVFSRNDRSFHAARFAMPRTATFSDADQAFFGEVA